MSTTDRVTAEGPPGSEFVAKRDRALLERHKPILRFDRHVAVRASEHPK